MRKSIVILFSITAGLFAANVTDFERVSTIQALQSMQKPTGFNAVEVAGRLAEQDGGGGRFIFTPGSTAITNSGTIFAAPYGASTGRWMRQYSGGLDIKWFGAITGGTFDCRNAIQAALIAAQSKHESVDITEGDFRLVVTKSIVIGNADIRRRGGRIFNSMPDWYTNTFTADEVIVSTNVLNEAGVLVNFTNAITVGSGYPWNGAGETFTGASNSIVENIWIDGGWGTTDAPAGVKPITGVRSDSDQMTYYQCFNDSTDNIIFKNCTFRHMPGAAIEVGHDFSVEGCTFEEFGDHAVYCGQDSNGGASQKNFKIIGNTFKAGRLIVGSNGDVGYVFQTFRQAIKMRGNSNTLVANNDFNDTNGLFTGIHLEVNDAQPGDIKRVTIANNHFVGAVFVDLLGFRSNGGWGTNDYRIRDVLIHGNVTETSNSAIRFRSACEGLVVKNNIFTSTAGAVATFCGHPAWTLPVKGLDFTGNKCYCANPLFIFLAGNFDDADFSVKNKFICTGAQATSANHVFAIGNPFDLDTVGILNLPFSANRLTVDENVAVNFFSLFSDGGVIAYDSGTTYTFATKNGIPLYNIVSSGGSLYRNTNTVIGAAPGGAGWAPFTRGNVTLLINDNKRHCSSTNASPNNSLYLAYFSGAAPILHANYTVLHSLNQNFNTLGEPVAYALGNVTEGFLNASSSFHLLKSQMVDSGGSTGAISGFSSLSVLNDFDFLYGGSGDQFSFGRGQTGSHYIDLANSGTGGISQIRVFTNTTVSVAISGDGTVAATTSVAAPNIYGTNLTGNLVSTNLTATANLDVLVLGADTLNVFRAQNADMHLDVGHGGTGLKSVRVYTNNTVSASLNGDGTISASASVTAPVFVGTLNGPITGSVAASVSSLPVYANNAAAVSGGLAVGKFYTTGSGGTPPDMISIVR